MRRHGDSAGCGNGARRPATDVTTSAGMECEWSVKGEGPARGRVSGAPTIANETGETHS